MNARMTARNKMADDPDPTIDVTMMHPNWQSELPDIEERCRGAVLAALSGRTASAGQEVSIVLADDAKVRELNSRYRGQDKPTNVLSFAQGEAGLLGDVVLAFETTKREAAEQRKTLGDHAGHLVVHGVLHLLGYDHESAKEARAMEAREREILAALGIADPYRQSANAAEAST